MPYYPFGRGRGKKAYRSQAHFVSAFLEFARSDPHRNATPDQINHAWLTRKGHFTPSQFNAFKLRQRKLESSVKELSKFRVASRPKSNAREKLSQSFRSAQAKESRGHHGPKRLTRRHE